MDKASRGRGRGSPVRQGSLRGPQGKFKSQVRRRRQTALGASLGNCCEAAPVEKLVSYGKRYSTRRSWALYISLRRVSRLNNNPSWLCVDLVLPSHIFWKSNLGFLLYQILLRMYFKGEGSLPIQTKDVISWIFDDVPYDQDMPVSLPEQPAGRLLTQFRSTSMLPIPQTQYPRDKHGALYENSPLGLEREE
jgi:hypothetical protein